MRDGVIVDAEEDDECAGCGGEFEKKSGVMVNPGMLGGAMSYDDVQKALHRNCPEHCKKRDGDDDDDDDDDDEDEDEDLLTDDGTPCHTVKTGDMCYDLVSYTVRKIITDPDFYPGLGQESTEAEVQARLHRDRPGICSRPCSANETEDVAKPFKSEGEGEGEGDEPKKEDKPEPCKRPNEAGDDCWGTIIWVLTEGVFQHPKWFLGLNQASSLEEVQAHLHEHPQDGMAPTCPPPCHQECRLAIEGEPCYDGVTWAMTEGIVNHSEWFVGLNEKSSFAEVQMNIHVNENSTVHCPQPCDVCHTAIDGERCFSAVQWVMTDGMKQSPESYPGLSAFSSFQEVQEHLHKNKSEEAAKCMKPCPVAQQ